LNFTIEEKAAQTGVNIFGIVEGGYGLLKLGGWIKSLLSVADDIGKVGGRVFWSGGADAMNAAAAYAKSNSMTTLEMTRAGQNLTKLTQGMPWEQAGPMWLRLSATYAKGAVGPVHVFQNATTGVRLQSVWRTVEYPILNGKNTFIFHNVFVP
jgi:hypothetical protein